LTFFFVLALKYTSTPVHSSLLLTQSPDTGELNVW